MGASTYSEHAFLNNTYTKALFKFFKTCIELQYSYLFTATNHFYYYADIN